VFVYQGTNFKLPECRVRSFPTAKITWKRIFWPLPVDRSIADGGSLTISRVQYKDEGYYVCEAENNLGKKLIVLEYLLGLQEQHSNLTKILIKLILNFLNL